MANCQFHDLVATISRKVPSTLWIECWLVSRANLDAVKMRKISTAAAATICSEPILQMQCCQHNFYLSSHFISYHRDGCKVTDLWQAKWVNGFWHNLIQKTEARFHWNGLNRMRSSKNEVGFVEKVITNESARNGYWSTKRTGVHNL